MTANERVLARDAGVVDILAGVATVAVAAVNRTVSHQCLPVKDVKACSSQRYVRELLRDSDYDRDDYVASRTQIPKTNS